MYSNELICDILLYIDNNLNSKISIDDLSHKFYFNRFYIMKLFKKEIGITISSYINKLRIYNSLEDIKNSNDYFIKIAINNGFYSLEYFSEIFNNVIGVSPSLFKKFSNYSSMLDEEKINIIRNNLIELRSFINFVNKYKNNKKPINNPTRVLSIFR